jgi:7-cyano-7-deazaguanine synthase in queuosine biosynthesis
MTLAPVNVRMPEIGVDVVERGRRPRKGRATFDLHRDAKFSSAGLEAYAFARSEPVISDALLVAAAVEYGDRIIRRPALGWARRISLRIPVVEQRRWEAPQVASTLCDALEFLTGDYWNIEFVRRLPSVPLVHQGRLPLLPQTRAVLPYSDGIDSRAVAAIVGASLQDRLVRVRVGSKRWDLPLGTFRREPFACVPYQVSCKKAHREATVRSRGFRFSMIGGLAAYLTRAEQILVPESSQGAIGSALVGVGHAYPDYRNHPLFAQRMARFLNALLGTNLQFSFPRIWYTKGETLREFVSLVGGNHWESTRSCWQSRWWSSVARKQRQCGVCAACMLRRVSIHAAGLSERSDAYVCTDMTAETLDKAVDPTFTRRTHAFREYAIAGALHMDHLARLAQADAKPLVRRHAILIAPALNLSPDEIEVRLSTVLQKHSAEWTNFLDSLGPRSFLDQWVQAAR